MANKIVAVLKYPPLSNTLKEHGRMELRRLTWDAPPRSAAPSTSRPSRRSAAGSPGGAARGLTAPGAYDWA